MPYKYSLLFQLNTTPTNLARASAHIAGWSETVWDDSGNVGIGALADLATKRALMLPISAKIVGYRVQQFTIVGNQLVPGGTASGAFNFPGNPIYVTDLPQVAVQLKAQAAGAPNTRRFTLRGMPDDIMRGGEYQPDAGFAGKMTQYTDMLVTGGWDFVGRDLSQASVRILGILARVVTTQNPMVGAAVGDFVRLLKVRDENRRPVTGTYAIETILGNAYTLRNLDPDVKAGASGRIRRDLIAFRAIGSVEVARALVKKVGRPFEQYRGRRSSRV